MKASDFLKKYPISQQVQDKLEAHLKSVEMDRIIRSFETCGICGGHVEFNHVTDQTQHKVQESGHCSSCRQKIPTRLFSLS